MKSQIEISSRAARPSVCVLSALLFLAAACSGGRSALPTEPVGAATSNSTRSSDSSDLAACGSMTKPCDPNNLGGATCESLGAGSGTLLCDPITCSYDRSMCTGTGTTGGGGLGALLGAFARNQGGRAAMGQGGRGGRMAMSNSGRGSREDDQDADEGGRGGEASQADEEDGEDEDDEQDDSEAGRGGEGGSGGSNAGAGGESAGQGGTAEAGASGEGAGGAAGESGSTPE